MMLHAGEDHGYRGVGGRTKQSKHPPKTAAEILKSVYGEQLIPKRKKPWYPSDAVINHESPQFLASTLPYQKREETRKKTPIHTPKSPLTKHENAQRWTSTVLNAFTTPSFLRVGPDDAVLDCNEYWTMPVHPPRQSRPEGGHQDSPGCSDHPLEWHWHDGCYCTTSDFQVDLEWVASETAALVNHATLLKQVGVEHDTEGVVRVNREEREIERLRKERFELEAQIAAMREQLLRKAEKGKQGKISRVAVKPVPIVGREAPPPVSRAPPRTASRERVRKSPASGARVSTAPRRLVSQDKVNIVQQSRTPQRPASSKKRSRAPPAAARQVVGATAISPPVVCSTPFPPKSSSTHGGLITLVAKAFCKYVIEAGLTSVAQDLTKRKSRSCGSTSSASANRHAFIGPTAPLIPGMPRPGPKNLSLGIEANDVPTSVKVAASSMVESGHPSLVAGESGSNGGQRRRRLSSQTGAAAASQPGGQVVVQRRKSSSNSKVLLVHSGAPAAADAATTIAPSPKRRSSSLSQSENTAQTLLNDISGNSQQRRRSSSPSINSDHNQSVPMTSRSDSNNKSSDAGAVNVALARNSVSSVAPAAGEQIVITPQAHSSSTQNHRSKGNSLDVVQSRGNEPDVVSQSPGAKRISSSLSHVEGAMNASAATNSQQRRRSSAPVIEAGGIVVNSASVVDPIVDPPVEAAIPTTSAVVRRGSSSLTELAASGGARLVVSDPPMLLRRASSTGANEVSSSSNTPAKLVSARKDHASAIIGVQPSLKNGRSSLISNSGEMSSSIAIEGRIGGTSEYDQQQHHQQEDALLPLVPEQRVVCLFGDHHYPGTVRRDNGDGTYYIGFDDGDIRENAPREEIHIHDPMDGSSHWTSSEGDVGLNAVSALSSGAELEHDSYAAASGKHAAESSSCYTQGEGAKSVDMYNEDFDEASTSLAYSVPQPVVADAAVVTAKQLVVDKDDEEQEETDELQSLPLDSAHGAGFSGVVDVTNSDDQEEQEEQQQSPTTVGSVGGVEAEEDSLWSLTEDGDEASDVMQAQQVMAPQSDRAKAAAARPTSAAKHNGRPESRGGADGGSRSKRVDTGAIEPSSYTSKDNSKRAEPSKQLPHKNSHKKEVTGSGRPSFGRGRQGTGAEVPSASRKVRPSRSQQRLAASSSSVVLEEEEEKEENECEENDYEENGCDDENDCEGDDYNDDENDFEDEGDGDSPESPTHSQQHQQNDSHSGSRQNEHGAEGSPVEHDDTFSVYTQQGLDSNTCEGSETLPVQDTHHKGASGYRRTQMDQSSHAETHEVSDNWENSDFGEFFDFKDEHFSGALSPPLAGLGEVEDTYVHSGDVSSSRKITREDSSPEDTVNTAPNSEYATGALEASLSYSDSLKSGVYADDFE